MRVELSDLTDWARCHPSVFIEVLLNPALLNADDRASSNWSPHNHDSGDE